MLQRKWIWTFTIIIGASCSPTHRPDAGAPAVPAAPVAASPIRPVAGWYSLPLTDVRAVLDIGQTASDWRFTDRASGAVLEVEAKDVRFGVDDSIQIREAPAVRVIKEPSHESGEVLREPRTLANAKKDCAGIVGCDRLTYCLGVVQICCSTNKAIGACIGAWDCGCRD